MSETLFRRVDYSLQQLVDAIDLGSIGLPDIQRPFVWEASKVRDLFDSMFRGFPVGYLLFWENPPEDAGETQIGIGEHLTYFFQLGSQLSIDASRSYIIG